MKKRMKGLVLFANCIDAIQRCDMLSFNLVFFKKDISFPKRNSFGDSRTVFERGTTFMHSSFLYTKTSVRTLFLILLMGSITSSLFIVNIAASAAFTLDEIANELKYRLESVSDVTAQVTFAQFSEKDGSKNEGMLKLEAIFPDLIRATWNSPEIYSGVFFILDTTKNTYTEYVPAMGEAHRLPLDQVIDQQSVIQLAPEQLFSLPSADDYNLKLINSVADLPSGYVIVEAVEKIERAQVFTMWVDTSRWLITRIEERDKDGRLVRLAEATNIRVNQNLNENTLRLLPPGTVERSGR